MTLSYVTSYKGSPHVTAYEAAALNLSMIGPMAYRLHPWYWSANNMNTNWGNVNQTYDSLVKATNFFNDSSIPTIGDEAQFKVVDNNTIQIPQAQWLWNGRHIINDSTVNITIDSGQIGQNRVDRICLNHTKDSSGRENIKFTVSKGVSTSGVAQPWNGYMDWNGYGTNSRDCYLTICLVYVNDLTVTVENPWGHLPYINPLVSLQYDLRNIKNSYVAQKTISFTRNIKEPADELNVQGALTPLAGKLGDDGATHLLTMRIYWNAAHLGANHPAWKQVELFKLNGWQATNESWGKAASNTPGNQLVSSYFSIMSNSSQVCWEVAAVNMENLAPVMWSRGSLIVPVKPL